MGRKITKPIYGKRKRKVTGNDEEKERITSLVRNLNDRLSQKGNSIPFDNEYYFAIYLAGDLRSLPIRAKYLAKNECKSANNFGESSKTSFNNSNSSGTAQQFNYSLPLSTPFSLILSSPIANSSTA